MHAWMFASEDARTAVDARTEFVEFLRSIGTGDELVYKAELVFGELLGNVVRHAPAPWRSRSTWLPAPQSFTLSIPAPSFPLPSRISPTTCSVSSAGAYSSCNNSQPTCASNVFPTAETTRS